MAGVIAFFDVLGYQSFLENNSTASTLDEALKVLTFIADLPKQVEQELLFQWMQDSAQRGEIGKVVANSCKHLIFSDTIVLSIQFPEASDERWQLTALAYLMLHSCKLFVYMFHKGLPMRAVITEGDFVFHESCLAGGAIVDAYKLCQSLDFAGLVFHKSVERRLPKLIVPMESDKILVPYLSPLNHGAKEERLVHVNWFGFYHSQNQTEIKVDIESFVYQSFWMHKKDCSLSVDRKVHNTIKLIRRLLMALQVPSPELAHLTGL